MMDEVSNFSVFNLYYFFISVYCNGKVIFILRFVLLRVKILFEVIGS